MLGLKKIEHRGFTISQDMDDESTWFTIEGPGIDHVDIYHPHLVQLILENDLVAKSLCTLIMDTVNDVIATQDLEAENRFVNGAELMDRAR